MSRPPIAARVRRSLFLLLCCCCLAAWSPPAVRALPLCTDGRAPVPLNRTLGFCSAYGGDSSSRSSCCDAAADSALRKRFVAMNISDAACAGVVKSVLCAECNPFSAELFNSSSKIQMVPLLCNYTSSASSAQSKDSTQDYCKLVWETCKNVTIVNSPFQPPLQGSAKLPSSSSKLTDVWQSEDEFCTSFGGSSGDQSLCFNGNAVFFNSTEPSPTPKGICLERIGNGSFLNMAPHPDGSNRVFLSSQAGKIWLATIPEQGSRGTLQYDEENPFLDITDEVHHDSQFGLMGVHVILMLTVIHQSSALTMVLSHASTKLLFQSILQKSPHLTFLWQHLPIHLRLEGFLQWDCRIQLTMEGKYYLDQQMDTFTL